MSDNLALLAGLGCGALGIGCLVSTLFRKSSAEVMSPNKKELYRVLPQPGEPDYKQITVADLKAHDFPADGEFLRKEKRSWMLLYGIVVDVTDYLDTHPGGVEIVGDQVTSLAEWAQSQDGPAPDAEGEYEPYHDLSVSREVAGLVGEPGCRPIYVGHFVQ
eukprot:TRINITY_DN50246_c0_g1_i1.p1 TRINITY_DN50246_c0_g1~~TRINITY_DN50246_c0_g1_i1.p1  ORF type:complete len:161 (+),score=48.59 TRINITY_DN50246_c0_g1_i1:52-534(+)